MIWMPIVINVVLLLIAFITTRLLFPNNNNKVDIYEPVSLAFGVISSFIELFFYIIIYGIAILLSAITWIIYFAVT